MARKKSIRAIRKLCDIEFSSLIRSLGLCTKCGRKDGLQCAHIISRSNYALRFDPINALPLCYQCHLHWAHKNPLEFAEWFQNKYPQRYNYLMSVKNYIIKRNLENYENLLKAIKERNIRQLTIGLQVVEKGGVV